MSLPDTCAKCQGEVERGFMVDHDDVGAHQAVWASGEPTRTFASPTGVGTSERTLAVVTLRCTRCGFLESFAPGSA